MVLTVVSSLSSHLPTYLFSSPPPSLPRQVLRSCLDATDNLAIHQKASCYYLPLFPPCSHRLLSHSISSLLNNPFSLPVYSIYIPQPLLPFFSPFYVVSFLPLVIPPILSSPLPILSFLSSLLRFLHPFPSLPPSPLSFLHGNPPSLYFFPLPLSQFIHSSPCALPHSSSPPPHSPLLPSVCTVSPVCHLWYPGKEIVWIPLSHMSSFVSQDRTPSNALNRESCQFI